MPKGMLVAAAGLLLACSNALADCQSRDPTKAEVEFYSRAVTTLREALPAAPAKWTLKVKDTQPKPDVCTLNKIGDFDVSVVGEYVYQPTKDEIDRNYAEGRKLRKDIEALRELPPEVKSERQVWLDKMSEANRASNAAYKAGDKVLARQKSDEAEGYSKKGREIRDAYWAKVQPQVDAMEARARTMFTGPLSVFVEVIANERYPKNPAPDSGKPISAGAVPMKSPALKVQGVRLMVRGPDYKRGEIEAAVDPDKLKRLVQ